MGHVHFDGQGGAGEREREEEVGKALPCLREGGERLSARVETRTCVCACCARPTLGDGRQRAKEMSCDTRHRACEAHTPLVPGPWRRGHLSDWRSTRVSPVPLFSLRLGGRSEGTRGGCDVCAPCEYPRPLCFDVPPLCQAFQSGLTLRTHTRKQWVVQAAWELAQRAVSVGGSVTRASHTHTATPELPRKALSIDKLSFHPRLSLPQNKVKGRMHGHLCEEWVCYQP